MITIHKDGKYSIKKDGTTFYRVMEGRKRIGSFLLLQAAKDYIEMKKKQAAS